MGMVVAPLGITVSAVGVESPAMRNNGSTREDKQRHEDHEKTCRDHDSCSAHEKFLCENWIDADAGFRARILVEHNSGNKAYLLTDGVCPTAQCHEFFPFT